MTDLERKILTILCKHSFDWLSGHIPYPSTDLSKELNESLYKVRKALKILKGLGYVESFSYCHMTEDRNYLMNGYRITKNAVNTQEYIKVKSEQENNINNLFNGNVC